MKSLRYLIHIPINIGLLLIIKQFDIGESIFFGLTKVIKDFRNEYKNIIIKPLYGNGGQGVFHVLPNDENFNSILEMFFNQNKEPLIIQEYLSDVRNGDKRIILVNGDVAGAINSRSAQRASSMWPMRSRRTFASVTSTPHFSQTTPRCFSRLYLPHKHS